MKKPLQAKSQGFREALQKQLDIIDNAQTLDRETINIVLERLKSTPKEKIVIVGKNDQIPSKYLK